MGTTLSMFDINKVKNGQEVFFGNISESLVYDERDIIKYIGTFPEINVTYEHLFVLIPFLNKEPVRFLMVSNDGKTIFNNCNSEEENRLCFSIYTLYMKPVKRKLTVFVFKDTNGVSFYSGVVESNRLLQIETLKKSSDLVYIHEFEVEE